MFNINADAVCQLIYYIVKQISENNRGGGGRELGVRGWRAGVRKPPEIEPRQRFSFPIRAYILRITRLKTMYAICNIRI